MTYHWYIYQPKHLTFVNMWLTVNSRGDYHVNDLGAVASIDQLIRTERVEAQRTAACLILRFYHDYHIETVAGKIFSLEDRERHEKTWHGSVLVFMAGSVNLGFVTKVVCAPVKRYLHSDGAFFGHSLVHPDEGHIVVKVIDRALKRKKRRLTHSIIKSKREKEMSRIK